MDSYVGPDVSLREGRYASWMKRVPFNLSELAISSNLAVDR